MNLVALMAGTLILSTVIYVTGAIAAAGKASTRHPLLRAPGGDHRGKPMPPTWHCEHTWELSQRIAAPYYRRQALTMIIACFIIGALSALNIDSRAGYVVIVALFVVTSYITFSIGGGQRGHQLAKLRCDHFDGEPVAPTTVPTRAHPYTHTPASKGHAGRALPVS